MTSGSNFGDVYPRFEWMKYLQQSTPRPVRFHLSLKSISYILFKLALFTLMFGFISYSWVGPMVARKFGTPGSGEIIDVMEHHGRGGPRYSMRVLFLNDANESQYENVAADDSDYAERPIGKFVAIHHLDFLRLASRDDKDLDMGGALIGLIVIFVFLGIGVKFILDMFSRRKLLMFGKLAEGTVLGISGSKTKYINFSYRIDGVVKLGKVPARGWTKSSVGESVLALADPDSERVTVIDSLFEWEVVQDVMIRE